VSKLAESLLFIGKLIDREDSPYSKNIDEPTPLEEKCRLVEEVKEKFIADLCECGVSFITCNVAWDIAERIEGADEGLNKGFLHTVLNYIEILENYYYDIQNEFNAKLRDIVEGKKYNL
jgi:hypothetical protein